MLIGIRITPKTMNKQMIQPVSARVETNKSTPAKASRPAKTESTRINATQRNTFRMMLATGATVAALVGAQAMAILDRSSSATSAQSSTSSSDTAISAPAAAIEYSTTNPTPAPATNYSSATTIQRAAAQPRPVTKSS
jgi:hypothetical protein